MRNKQIISEPVYGALIKFLKIKYPNLDKKVFDKVINTYYPKLKWKPLKYQKMMLSFRIKMGNYTQ